MRGGEEKVKDRKEKEEGEEKGETGGKGLERRNIFIENKVWGTVGNHSY